MKSAVLDLTIDPVDFLAPEDIADQALSTFEKPETLRSTAASLSRGSLTEAEHTWSVAISVPGVALLFERLRAASALRFGFYNYVQHPIAYAFTLAKVGRMAEASAELSKVLDRVASVVHGPLQKALEEANHNAA